MVKEDKEEGIRLSYEGYGGPRQHSHPRKGREQGVQGAQNDADTSPLTRLKEAQASFRKKTSTERKEGPLQRRLNQNERHNKKGRESFIKGNRPNKSRKSLPSNSNLPSKQTKMGEKPRTECAKRHDNKKGFEKQQNKFEEAKKRFINRYNKATELETYDDDPDVMKELEKSKGAISSKRDTIGQKNLISSESQDSAASPVKETNDSNATEEKAVKVEQSMQEAKPKRNKESKERIVEHKGVKRRKAPSLTEQLASILKSKASIIVVKYMLGELVRGQMIIDNEHSSKVVASNIQENTPNEFELVKGQYIQSREYEDTIYIDIFIIPILAKIKHSPSNK